MSQTCDHLVRLMPKASPSRVRVKVSFMLLLCCKKKFAGDSIKQMAMVILLDKVRQGVLPPPVVLRYCTQTCWGL
jgi:hypothetical protein